MEAAAYESLSVGLTFGINSALFLDPVKKYSDPSVRDGILRKFIEAKAMGGLMITEPDFGTNALSMQSAYQTVEGGYAIQGTKHWGGLTGQANFWLVVVINGEHSQSAGAKVYIAYELDPELFFKGIL